MAATLIPTVPRTAPSDPANRMLAAFATRAPVGAGALARAVPVLLDTLGVTLAGGREPGVVRLAGGLPGAGRDVGIRSFWSDARYAEGDAALLFGMASHILDYDDVSMLAICHPSVPVLATLLAGADRARTSGRALLEALVVGTEVTIRLGEALGFRHYALGFHATATLGTIGAAAALARVRGLGEAGTRHALAIAASLSGGLRVNFGSHVKSLHVGFAAANALRAVRLANAGLEGSDEPFEGASGFLRAFSGGTVTAWPEAVVLGSPFAIEDPGFEQKRYPCCYLLHKMIEGTLVLRRETGLDLAAFAAVRVEVPPGGASALIHPYPKSGLNALFSGPYAICAALADGRIDLASFTDEAVRRPEIQRRLRDVTVVERGGSAAGGHDVGGAPVTVTLTARDGATVAHVVTASPGSMADPITPEQARAKWVDCVRRGVRGTRGAIADAKAARLYEDGVAIRGAGAIDGWLDRLAAAISGEVAS